MEVMLEAMLYLVHFQELKARLRNVQVKASRVQRSLDSAFKSCALMLIAAFTMNLPLCYLLVQATSTPSLNCSPIYTVMLINAMLSSLGFGSIPVFRFKYMTNFEVENLVAKVNSFHSRVAFPGIMRLAVSLTHRLDDDVEDSLIVVEAEHFYLKKECELMKERVNEMPVCATKLAHRYQLILFFMAFASFSLPVSLSIASYMHLCK